MENTEQFQSQLKKDTNICVGICCFIFGLLIYKILTGDPNNPISWLRVPLGIATFLFIVYPQGFADINMKPTKYIREHHLWGMKDRFTRRFIKIFAAFVLFFLEVTLGFIILFLIATPMASSSVTADQNKKEQDAFYKDYYEKNKYKF